MKKKLALFMLTICAICLSGMMDKQKSLPSSYLATLYGRDACKECQNDGKRIDECYHYGWFDECRSDRCIANYLVEDTCVLGSGTCTAVMSPNAASTIQYVREDSNCTTDNPTEFQLWVTHYYGGENCEAYDYHTRCEKNNGDCSGTLITSNTLYPGIDCQ